MKSRYNIALVPMINGNQRELWIRTLSCQHAFSWHPELYQLINCAILVPHQISFSEWTGARHCEPRALCVAWQSRGIRGQV